MSSWRSFRVSPLGGALATLPATAAVENATTASPAATKPTYGATDGPDDSGGAARSAESSIGEQLGRRRAREGGDCGDRRARRGRVSGGGTGAGAFGAASSRPN